MGKVLIKGGLVGGLILFIWSAVSWMLLPWHLMTMNGFKEEAAVTQTITANVPSSGVYLLPISMQTPQATSGPLMFATVKLESNWPMSLLLVMSLVIQIVAAFLVTWLLTKTRDLSYMGRVGFVIVFALTAGIVTLLPLWNWFFFPLNYTLIGIADLLIGWLLAGLWIAKTTTR